ncbi:MAG: VIT1/CCC1 transporter family protein [Candidatus Omnitrophica bacterium]|nr:VIT1/CCC1 transporter family protein [Candidatus Omnitrophota bacterium]
MELKLILSIQKSELTDHIVYKQLAGLVKKEEHRKILEKISDEELKHYQIFKNLSGKETTPNKFKIFLFVVLSRFLGLNFGLKLMESAEGIAQGTYEKLKVKSAEVESLIRNEEEHEKEIISLIDEERLKYISSMVLGLNDALVELTAALAGFTLALQNSRLIGVVGLITGIAAAMSMAASEYLSTKQEDTEKNPFKASIYTGLAYIITVILLVSPYFIHQNIFFSLGSVVTTALFIILVFTFYISIAKGLSFKKRFIEMAGLSLSIAFLTFFIGLLVRKVFGIEI